MLLKAMVTRSKFREIVEKLSTREVIGVSMVENYFGDDNIPIITANATTDRMLEIAQDVQATPVLDDFMPSNYKRICLDAHSEAGDYQSDNALGQLWIWHRSYGWGE